MPLLLLEGRSLRVRLSCVVSISKARPTTLRNVFIEGGLESQGKSSNQYELGCDVQIRWLRCPTMQGLAET